MRFLAALLLLAPASAETTTRHATRMGREAVQRGETVLARSGDSQGIVWRYGERRGRDVRRDQDLETELHHREAAEVASATPLGAVIDISRGEGIALHDANYVTVSGFRINQHAGAEFGIQINGGIGVTMKDITIVGDTTTCETVPRIGDHVYAFDTTGLTLDGLNVGKPENGECNYVEDTACFSLPRNTGTTLKNSTCHDIRNFGTFANSSDVTVDGNTIVNLHNHGIGMVDVTNAVVQRNIFTATSTATNIGDALWLVCSHGINFRNNLIHGTSLFPVGAYTSHPNCDNSANRDRIGNDWPSNDGILPRTTSTSTARSPDADGRYRSGTSTGRAGRPSSQLQHVQREQLRRASSPPYRTLEAWTAARVLGYPQDAKSLTARLGSRMKPRWTTGRPLRRPLRWYGRRCQLRQHDRRGPATWGRSSWCRPPDPALDEGFGRAMPWSMRSREHENDGAHGRASRRLRRGPPRRRPSRQRFRDVLPGRELPAADRAAEQNVGKGVKRPPA
jgi:hypothetical protein